MFKHSLILNVSLYLYGFLMSKKFFSSALLEPESWHRDAFITQGENCNSKKICLLFGLVAVNANELADSAGKELSLFSFLSG